MKDTRYVIEIGWKKIENKSRLTGGTAWRRSDPGPKNHPQCCQMEMYEWKFGRNKKNLTSCRSSCHDVCCIRKSGEMLSVGEHTVWDYPWALIRLDKKKTTTVSMNIRNIWFNEHGWSFCLDTVKNKICSFSEI